MEKIELQVSYKSIFRVVGVAALLYVLVKLSALITTLFLAIMLAVTLRPFLNWMEAKRMPRWFGLMAIAAGMILAVAFICMVVLPPLLEQITAMLNRFPEMQKSLMEVMPKTGPLRTMATKSIHALTVPDPEKIATPLLSVGQMAIGGLTQVFLVLIFSIYLLSDGPRTVQWILAFFSDERRRKLQATAFESSKVISAYVAGQAITSLICGVYTYIVLMILDVPAALMLATIAGIFDILPVLGFFLAAAPAVIFAFTVSSWTAFLVLLMYILYHILENYLLIPKIYGNRLRLSDLVVLVSLLAAGTFGGIAGAIVILPLVASYPIIERIWLVNVVGRTTVRKHSEVEAEAQVEAAQVRPDFNVVPHT
jgi:predicted PurR-regulated permease PerM